MQKREWIRCIEQKAFWPKHSITKAVCLFEASKIRSACKRTLQNRLCKIHETAQATGRSRLFRCKHEHSAGLFPTRAHAKHAPPKISPLAGFPKPEAHPHRHRPTGDTDSVSPSSLVVRRIADRPLQPRCTASAECMRLILRDKRRLSSQIAGLREPCPPPCPPNLYGEGHAAACRRTRAAGI